MAIRRNLSIDYIWECIINSETEDESNTEEYEFNFSEIVNNVTNVHSDPSGVVENTGMHRPKSEYENDNEEIVYPISHEDVVKEEPESDEEDYV